MEKQYSEQSSLSKIGKANLQKGAALPAAMIILAILGVIAVSALAFSSTEARIAGSDLIRTQTFYATVAAMEKLTYDFSELYRSRVTVTDADLDIIEANPPSELVNEGFTFQQNIEQDHERLAALRASQGISAPAFPRVIIPEGAFSGLSATLIPYKMTSTGTSSGIKSKVTLEREMNNYLIPLFQFGLFSAEDLEIHPGFLMTFTGRVHANGNIYALRNTRFLGRVTTAGEFVRDAWRSGRNNVGFSGSNNVYVTVGNIDVQSEIGKGSVQGGGGTVGGPYFSTTPGTRGYHPGSPTGLVNPDWDTDSMATATVGVPNRFSGQVQTQSTGVTKLRLPLELEGSAPVQIIKRAMPSDGAILSAARYHNKAQVRILIDDENAGTGAANVAGIPVGKGVDLSTFIPTALNGGNGNVLRRHNDAGTALDSTVTQLTPTSSQTAKTVRRAASVGIQDSTCNCWIPGGAGLSGKIYIEIIDSNGVSRDVTEAILSMGITEGEPNGIIYLQRPLWAAFTQTSRDRLNLGTDMVSLTNSSNNVADGEIPNLVPATDFDSTIGFMKKQASLMNEDTATVIRQAAPSPMPTPIDFTTMTDFNQIVPINLYDVREGWFNNSMNEYQIYERGMMNLTVINMKNLVRWLDGTYNAGLLNGTNAVSTNIEGSQGYVVYFSDRRGDGVKTETDKSGIINTTNGFVDNEDIYGPNGTLDLGEDVINVGKDGSGNPKKGTLQKDVNELPDMGTVYGSSGMSFNQKMNRAIDLMNWRNPNNHFRRALKVVNAEVLQTTGGANKLNATRGLTISTENPIYIGGSYNTTGVTTMPPNGSSLNTGDYAGPQVPSSLVGDAFSPLSKTWFDALTAIHPEGTSGGKDGNNGGSYTQYREADVGIGITGADLVKATAVRAGITAGTTISAASASPGRNANNDRLSGGIANYPRFLENWTWNLDRPWSFTGSFVPLFYSTQAIAPWENATPVIYGPPRRNWSFDTGFRTPAKLPPGTPYFQYVQPTGFRQKIAE